MPNRLNDFWKAVWRSVTVKTAFLMAFFKVLGDPYSFAKTLYGGTYNLVHRKSFSKNFGIFLFLLRERFLSQQHF